MKIMLKFYHLLLAMLLLADLPANATGNNQPQKNAKGQRTVRVSGDIQDSFTKAGLKALVTIMSEDSTIIAKDSTNGYRQSYTYGMEIPARLGNYIVKAECNGYETKYANHTVKYIGRNKWLKFPSLTLKKKAASREVMLDGVVVTTTKVKFAYRGDTLVYDASAFNVPDGSMLDVLVRQMPGAEIKSNGDIYINGKKIDYLLLNGKEFFKGKNQVMLDNLPYYTVKDLKVYDRSTEKSQLLGKEVEKKDYVLDVGLKREYSRGYIANAEVAGGTKDRYLSRLFGLYYTDRMRLAVYGNVNNVNETRRPGGEGDWSPANNPQGQKTTRQAGMDFSIESKGGKVRESADATFEWTKLQDISRTSTENFSADGNIFGRSIADSRNSSHKFQLSNNLQLQGSTGLWLDTDINYSDGKSSSSSRSATYSAAPGGAGGINATIDSTFAENIQGTLRDIIINRSLGYGRSKTRTFGFNSECMAWQNLPWGDRLELHASGHYTNTKPSESFSLNRNDYFKTGTNDLRDIYSDNHNSSYNFSAELKYALEIPNSHWAVLAGPTYKQDYSSIANLRYRLDELEGEYTSTPERMFATLPEDANMLASVLDGKTSRRYTRIKRIAGGALVMRYTHKSSILEATLDAVEERERINYHGTAIDTTAARHRTLLLPSFFFNHYSNKLYAYVQYYMKSEYPEFANIMPYTDDSNPLSITINNPKLKRSIYHHYDINFRLNGLKHEQYVGFFATGNFYHNTVATRTTYNTQTGGYTYMSDNINRGGDWDFWTTASYGTALGKKRLFRLDYRLWFNGLRRNVFDIAYDDNPATICHSLNTELGNSLYLRFQKNKLSINIGGKMEWKHTTSNRENFEKISAYNFEYGGNLTYTMPFGISLSTDIKEYCRRGYSEKSFNTSDLVWNASLARSFCKGYLTLRAEAFDILHNLSNTQYEINGQGRVETWRNTLPNYAMLHLTYKFNKMPKDKK